MAWAGIRTSRLPAAYFRLTLFLPAIKFTSLPVMKAAIYLMSLFAAANAIAGEPALPEGLTLEGSRPTWAPSAPLSLGIPPKFHLTAPGPLASPLPAPFPVRILSAEPVGSSSGAVPAPGNYRTAPWQMFVHVPSSEAFRMPTLAPQGADYAMRLIEPPLTFSATPPR